METSIMGYIGFGAVKVSDKVFNLIGGFDKGLQGTRCEKCCGSDLGISGRR